MTGRRRWLAGAVVAVLVMAAVGAWFGLRSPAALTDEQRPEWARGVADLAVGPGLIGATYKDVKSRFERSDFPDSTTGGCAFTLALLRPPALLSSQDFRFEASDGPCADAHLVSIDLQFRAGGGADGGDLAHAIDKQVGIDVLKPPGVARRDPAGNLSTLWTIRPGILAQVDQHLAGNLAGSDRGFRLWVTALPMLAVP